MTACKKGDRVPFEKKGKRNGKNFPGRGQIAFFGGMGGAPRTKGGKEMKKITLNTAILPENQRSLGWGVRMMEFRTLISSLMNQEEGGPCQEKKGE